MNIKSVFLSFIIFGSVICCTKGILKIIDLTRVSEQNKKPALKSASINYYVATNGSDSNPGTSASPFKTIQKAANVVNPGDNVIIRDGVYSASSLCQVLINRTGTADNYITFRSENKWGAILDGGNTYGYAFQLYSGASYIKILDFEMRNYLNFGIYQNDIPHPSSHVIIQGNKIHDIGRISTSSGYGMGGVYLSCTSSYWTFTQNLMYNLGRTGPDSYYMNKDHAIYFGASDTPANAAIGHVVSYNIMYGCSGAAITDGGTNGMLVANNIIAWSNSNSRGAMSAIASGDATTNLTIANNIIYYISSSEAYAIWSPVNIPRTGWSIKNNMIYGYNSTMFYPGEDKETSAIAAMKSGNYGYRCELPAVDPLFVSAIKTNAPNVDFSLQKTSPAIKAGANVGLTTDYLKNAILTPPCIGAIEYNSGQVPAVYYNTQTSATATKNDCGTGYTGSTVTYTVPTNKYSSTVSQADAESKATADLSANKQTYANANGTCTAIPVYYNVQKSGTATRNNCGTGYTGSKVTYTVPAKKYISNISQADADNKAIADVTTNKQAYANTNGTCIKIWWWR